MSMGQMSLGGRSWQIHLLSSSPGRSHVVYGCQVASQKESCGSSLIAVHASCDWLENMPVRLLHPLPIFLLLGVACLRKQILKLLPQALLSEEPRVDSSS